MATTINEVISQLSDIVDAAALRSDRLGYFAALYRRVTVRVKERVVQGLFQNNSQMERLDVEFANRYLDAYHQFQNHQPTTASWAVTFDATQKWRPLIIQHLLLGMNAHINLDLGVAAQKTCPDDNLLSLKSDFNMINQILAEMVQPVETQLAKVSPWLGLLDQINPRADDAILNFSMNVARSSAWQFALELNALNDAERSAAIQRRDAQIAELANKVATPRGFVLNAGLLAIRLRESSDVKQVIGTIR
jgi:hypothetical protein